MFVSLEETLSSHFPRASEPRRYHHPPPQRTHRYVKWISAQPVEDPRLGHGAVRLLQAIRSLAGRHDWLETTQSSLGQRINRSSRTIRRYLRELKRFGYLLIQKRTNRLGLITGLYLTLTRTVLPKFKDKRLQPRRKPDRTHLADIKVKDSYSERERKLSTGNLELDRALYSLGTAIQSRSRHQATQTHEPSYAHQAFRPPTLT